MGLADELLLLAYDDQTGKATVSGIALDLGLAASLLVELAMAGRIDVVDGKVVLIDPTPTGDELADDVLARIAGDDRPRPPESWVQRLRAGLRHRVLDELVGKGVVRDQEDTVLGFIPVHRYPATDPAPEADSRARLTAAVVGGQEPDRRTSALCSLVLALRMEKALFPDRPVKEAQARLSAIAEGDWSGPAARRAIDAVHAALIAAMTAAVGGAVAAS